MTADHYRYQLCAVADCRDPGLNRVRDEEDGTEYWFCDGHVAAYCEPREP